MNLQTLHLNPKPPPSLLRGTLLTFPSGVEVRHSPNSRENFLKQLKTFPDYLRCQNHHACDISAWARQALDNALLDDIGIRHHDYWDVVRRPAGRGGRRCDGRQDHVHFGRHKVGDQFSPPIGPRFGPTILDVQSFTLGIAEVTQTFTQRPERHGLLLGCTGHEETDARNFRLLSLSGKRRKHQTDSEKNRESDPPHAHLVGMAGRSLAEEDSSQELAALVEHALLLRK